ENDINPYQTVQVDILTGGAGDDRLRGSDFADRLSGDSGNDVIEHTAGDDVVFGGTDPLPAGGTTTDGAQESDTYLVYGSDSADTISVQLQSNGTSAPQVTVVVNGVSTRVNYLGVEVAGVAALGGDDTITVAFGQNAALKVDADGGDGNDRLDASTSQANVTFRGGPGHHTLTRGV